MPPEQDLMEVLADVPGVGGPRLSDWLRDTDMARLAALARAARLAGESFGRRLRARE